MCRYINYIQYINIYAHNVDSAHRNKTLHTQPHTSMHICTQAHVHARMQTLIQGVSEAVRWKTTLWHSSH